MFAAHLASVPVAALFANFHPSVVATTLFAHFTAFLRPAFVALDLAGGS
jgi:hypothetical protein